MLHRAEGLVFHPVGYSVCIRALDLDLSLALFVELNSVRDQNGFAILAPGPEENLLENDPLQRRSSGCFDTNGLRLMEQRVDSSSMQPPFAPSGGLLGTNTSPWNLIVGASSP